MRSGVSASGWLACHGKPKGETDPLGLLKDDLQAGDFIGLMSVTLAVSD